MKAENLRKSILQMAIQGKLVPQNPDDEPASVLLERIRAEKQRLIKEGKIKKDKTDSVIFKGDDNRHYEKIGDNPPVCIEDELPFEIPDSWTWTRFSAVGNLKSGYAFKSSEYVKSGIQVVRISDLGDNEIYQKNAVYYPPAKELSDYLVTKGSFLICQTGSIGKMAWVTDDKVRYLNQRVGMYIPTEMCNKSYLWAFLHTQYVLDLWISAKTSTNGNIKNSDILDLYLPLPPLAEQKRIVAEIEKYEPLIAEYDKLEQEKSKLDGEIYDKLKKSILQYAIQGKLVPQEPTDEPASVLLEKIRAEKKAKLGKKYVDSFIYKGDDNCYYEHIDGIAEDKPVEVPFDLPDSWAWCKLKDIAFTQTGTTPSTSERENFGHHIPFIKPGDIMNGKIDYYNEGLSQMGLLKGRLIKQDSILMVCIGGSIGKCALCDRDVSCNQQINTATPENEIAPQYLYDCLLSDYFYKAVIENATGTATPIINRSQWENIFIPLPPLAEQQRIVDKINEIFANL